MICQTYLRVPYLKDSNRYLPYFINQLNNTDYNFSKETKILKLLNIFFPFHQSQTCVLRTFKDDQIINQTIASSFEYFNSLTQLMQQYYKVPDAQQRKVALGSLPGLPYRVKKCLESIKDMFQPMDKPIQGEWLWQHEEQGQSYDAYKGQMHNEIDEKRNVIYIKPLEKIDGGFLHELKRFCECFFYPMKIKIASEMDSMKGVTKRINPYTEKEQFNARDILTVLKKKLPPDAFCLIGVCMTDLYPREEWNFVFGLASIRERTGVFSFARYDERFFEEKAYQIDYNLIKYRSMGVVAHQVTHMFGVRHCIYYKCLMNGSNHLQESSKKPSYLCVVCLRKMQSNIKFDIMERYIQLKQFYEEQKDARVKKTMEFYNAAIKRIQENLKV